MSIRFNSSVFVVGGVNSIQLVVGGDVQAYSLVSFQFNWLLLVMLRFSVVGWLLL